MGEQFIPIAKRDEERRTFKVLCFHGSIRIPDELMLEISKYLTKNDVITPLRFIMQDGVRKLYLSLKDLRVGKVKQKTFDGKVAYERKRLLNQRFARIKHGILYITSKEVSSLFGVRTSKEISHAAHIELKNGILLLTPAEYVGEKGFHKKFF